MLEEEIENEADKSFIKIVSRNHPMFKLRCASLITMNKEGKIITETLPPIPDDTIICDGCNSLIKDDFVGLLMLEVNRCWGTQCKDCVKKYFSDLPVVYEKTT